MRILYIIPGFDEGGAEVHLLNLIRELSGPGNDITLASSGGHLENELPEGTHIIHLPVWQKNLFTATYSALKLKSLNKNFHWDIIHAHSRVPALVSWILSASTGIKWIMTAHALYSLNLGLIPLRHSDGVICVSEAVKNHLKDYLPPNSITIPNGIIPPKLKHNDINGIKFLFVGRLTRLKGLDVVLNALNDLKNYNWTLDVIGEGHQHNELEKLSLELGLNERVYFHGAKDKSEVEAFMSNSSCLLFPSYNEGMGLVVLEALSIGLPVIASDLEALHELAEGDAVSAGDVTGWTEAIRKFITEGKSTRFDSRKIITVHDMALRVMNYYESIIKDDPE